MSVKRESTVHIPLEAVSQFQGFKAFTFVEIRYLFVCINYRILWARAIPNFPSRILMWPEQIMNKCLFTKLMIPWLLITFDFTIGQFCPILTQDWYKNKLKEILLYSCFTHKLGFPSSRGGGMYTPDSKWQNYWIKTKISPGLIQQIPKWSLDQTLSPSPKKLSCKFTSLRIHFKLKEFLKGLTLIYLGLFTPFSFQTKNVRVMTKSLNSVSKFHIN